MEERTLIDVLAEALQRAPEIRRRDIAEAINDERWPGGPHSADVGGAAWDAYHRETRRMIEEAWAAEGITP